MTKSVTKSVTEPKFEGRVVKGDSARRAQTWFQLFEAFRELGMYRNDVDADLKPLWRKIQRHREDAYLQLEPDNRDPSNDPRFAVAFWKLQDLVVDPGGEDELGPLGASSDVKLYVARIEDFVANRLRLTTGQAANPEAMEWLHADVSGSLLPAQGWTEFSDVTVLDFTVTISASDAVLEAGGADGWATLHSVAGELFQRLGPADLNEFTAAATQHFRDRLAEEVQNVLRSYKESKEVRNPTNLQWRFGQDVPALAELLYRGRRPGEIREKRLRRIVKDLGLDWPKTPRRRSRG